jgi:cytochrome c
VVYVEPIELREQNARVRDIAEADDGSIVLWLDNGSIAALEPVLEEEMRRAQSGSATHLRGQLLFARCTVCHSARDGTSHGIGPDLAGVVERRIGGAAGYSYSRALATRSGTWSASRLDEFLANPQRFAPGTSMQFEGIPDRADRAELIDYLKTLK